MGKRYWEDLVEGERFTCRPVAFDREGIIAFGKEYDPLPFHVGGEASDRSIFGGPIASALHTLSCCTRVVVEAHGEIAILSGLSIDEVKATGPVRPGDVLTVEGRWDGLRRSRSNPSRGIAGVKCRVVNQRGETVLEHGYRYLVACRPEGSRNTRGGHGERTPEGGPPNGGRKCGTGGDPAMVASRFRATLQT